MSAEWVLDASVAVKCFITEPGSDQARALAAASARLIAPEFIFAELASVAVKRTRRGDIDRAFADDMTVSAPGLFDETFPTGPLTPRAQEIAFEHGASIYDALYLALAEACDAMMVTADEKLVARLKRSNLEDRVRLLPESEEGR